MRQPGKLLALAVALTSLTALASGGSSGSLQTFGLPNSTCQPNDITVAPDGNVWFTMGSKIFKMTTSGEMTEYVVTSSIYPNLLGITVGPDGALWFAEHQGNKIGRIDVAGNITEFGPVDQPHTIGAGPDGNLWFTMPASHTIGRITPTGTITLFPLAGSPQPWNPVAGPDGNVWFTEYLTSKLAKITPNGVVTEVQTVLSAWGLARGAGNTLWITQATEGKISKFTVAP